LPTAGTRDGRQKSVHAAVVSAAIRAGIGALRGSAPAINDNDGLIAIGQRAAQLRLMVDVHFKAFFSLAC
jgi:hypothetical protein